MASCIIMFTEGQHQLVLTSSRELTQAGPRCCLASRHLTAASITCPQRLCNPLHEVCRWLACLGLPSQCRVPQLPMVACKTQGRHSKSGSLTGPIDTSHHCWYTRNSHLTVGSILPVDKLASNCFEKYYQRQQLYTVANSTHVMLHLLTYMFL